MIAGLILGQSKSSPSRNLGRFTGMIRNMSGDIRDIARALSMELDAIEDVKAAKRIWRRFRQTSLPYNVMSMPHVVN